MFRNFFHSIEGYSDGDRLPINTVLDNLFFNEAGLIPVITQDAKTKDVLMFAWMNKEALDMTLSTQRMTYWSRSRNQLWIKGETSGHTQAMVSMAFDCDGDVVLCLVNQSGAACHTGRKDCFYLDVDIKAQQIVIKGDAQAV
ncbi:phosphoribosyl-AMP cyclohydrolase [Vibrio sp. WJH972]